MVQLPVLDGGSQRRITEVQLLSWAMGRFGAAGTPWEEKTRTKSSVTSTSAGALFCRSGIRYVRSLRSSCALQREHSGLHWVTGTTRAKAMSRSRTPTTVGLTPPYQQLGENRAACKPRCLDVVSQCYSTGNFFLLTASGQLHCNSPGSSLWDRLRQKPLGCRGSVWAQLL